MAHADNGSSIDVDRRVSTRSSVAPSFISMDDDNYDYDYDSDDSNAIGISDGFRPSNIATESMRMAGQGHQSFPSSSIQTTTARTSQYIPPSPRRSTPPPRPSSTTKPRRSDTFALRHDGATNHNAPLSPSAVASSSRPMQLTRSPSVSTVDSFIIRPESPYTGPSAPSHPYQIYNQNAPLTRTASIATTSTYQPHIERESVYNGPSAPTHAYTLYPQNTVEEPEDPITVPTTIPGGFPGRVDGYQRRLGPEGEEAADLIGPDGHTEQLPPYTQYPDAAFARKAAAMSTALPLPIVSGENGGSNSSPLSQDGPVNPFETPISRSSTIRSSNLNSQGPVSRKPSSMMTPENEKEELKPWQIFLKRKACGVVPVWVLFLAGILVVLFAIIAGVAVDMTRRGGHGPPPDPSISPSPTSQQYQYGTTVTSTYDATPTTAPSGLPFLPTGTYWLNIESAQTQSTSCIPNTSKYAAWSCTMAMGMLRMNVQSGNAGSGNQISIFENPGSTSSMSPPDYSYGTQPPTISGAQVMSLVSDANFKSYGPAWFFQLPYDKLVIVSSGALSVPTAKRSYMWKSKYNSMKAYGTDPVRRTQAPQVGETPWFCYWNHTLLETFIYPQVNSSYNAATSSTMSSASSAAATAGSQTSGANAAAASGSNVLNQLVPPYPKIVRVKERRLQYNAIDPYCVQMEIQSNGWARPHLDVNGQRIIIQLNETEQVTVQNNGKRDESVPIGGIDKRETDSDCNCVWLAS